MSFYGWKLDAEYTRAARDIGAMGDKNQFFIEKALTSVILTQ